MRVLALNWRDPGHPEAGGAEVHLFEILRRWARRGAEVTWIASGFPGGPAEEQRDGVRILRRGSWWNANWAAAASVRGELAREAFDLVVEDINKIPYLTPLYVRAPVLAVVPHLFGTTAFAEASWPIAVVVRVHEAFLPWVYRRVPFLAISESTRQDLIERGLSPGRVVVSHCGLDHSRYSPGGRKTEQPTVAFVGRLRRYKGVSTLLRAFATVRRRLPSARLVVMGDGPHRATLERDARALGESGAVEFTGFLPAGEKVRRLREAWVSALSSPKEGWGLTVVESNACGTPVVASRSPGLVDSVQDGVSGILVPHGDPARLATELERVLTDGELRARLSRGGLAWARRFDWDRAAAEAWQVACAVVEHRQLPRAFAGAGEEPRPEEPGLTRETA